MGRHSTTIVPAVITPPSSPSPSRKRKREEHSTADIEINVSAPEPPSKKALRKAKKTKITSHTNEAGIPAVHASKTGPIAVGSASASDNDQQGPSLPAKRSEHGIWIGNLPWTASKLDVRNFLTKDTGIEDEAITRIHMPAPSKMEAANSHRRVKAQNRGFAYVDFLNQEALTEALALSEKLLTGRRVLIKDSKSFEGRPEKTNAETAAAMSSAKPPSNRIFVGNLAFDASGDILREHFARCGEIADVFLTTFEDTGKCKGYGWVTFASTMGAEEAVRGWVEFEDTKENGNNEDDEITEALADANDAKPKKKAKIRKWWVNRLGGRPLKLEFAEGKDVRYKKRYGKDGTTAKKREGEIVKDLATTSMAQPIERKPERRPQRQFDGQKRDAKPFIKVDARTIKPGAALAAAPRSTGSIVESTGKKTNLT